MRLPHKKPNLLEDVPASRWREDFELLQGVGRSLLEEANDVGRSEMPEDKEIANALYQEAYACNRAAALLAAIVDAESPERETLSQMLALFPPVPKGK